MRAEDWHNLENALDKLSPSEKRQLIERLNRSVEGAPAPPSTEDQLHQLRRLSEELRQLPVRHPADGWSGRDHDRILYGQGH